MRQGEVKGEAREIDGLGLGFGLQFLGSSLFVLLSFPCDSSAFLIVHNLLPFFPMILRT